LNISSKSYIRPVWVKIKYVRKITVRGDGTKFRQSPFGIFGYETPRKLYGNLKRHVFQLMFNLFSSWKERLSNFPQTPDITKTSGVESGAHRERS